MSHNYTRKCKTCKGSGRESFKKMDASAARICKACEGTGIQLYDHSKDSFDEFTEFTGEKIHEDDINYIDVDEDE